MTEQTDAAAFYAEHYSDWTVHALPLMVYIPTRDGSREDVMELVQETLDDAAWDIRIEPLARSRHPARSCTAASTACAPRTSAAAICASVLREQIAAWLADFPWTETARNDLLAALVAPSRVTHCANCGAEVPMDQPHQVGECVAPSRVPGEET